MREKNLFHLLIGLNVVLAAAFVVYLFLSSHRHPKVVSKDFPKPETSQGPGRSWTEAREGGEAGEGTNHLEETAGAPPPATNSPAEPAAMAKPVFTKQTFDWRHVESDDYASYLNSLRAVGCPEDKIRLITLQDINDLMAQKRLKEAVAHDMEWWRAEPASAMMNVLKDKGVDLDDQRQQLMARWLGEDVASAERSHSPFWNTVQLTGPVLGALNGDLHDKVQEICAESIDRYQSIFWTGVNAGQQVNKMDMAKLRERTRSELVKVLNGDAVEEFLLRYSHNANNLRQELRGLNPTPEEFRKIFRATDAMDHALQLEFGGPESLSPAQTERHERQRTQIVREILAPDRFQSYLLTKDPLYRQAQLMATQYGAPSSAIPPLYEMTKANEQKRQTIMQNAVLTPDQKRQAINAVFQEQQRAVQKIVSEAAAQPR